MPKQVHPRGAEWERGRQAGYYSGKLSNLKYLRECRKENKRLRAACRLALLDLQKTYANFDFDLWYQSWGNGERHPGETAIQELREALAGGGE